MEPQNGFFNWRMGKPGLHTREPVSLKENAHEARIACFPRQNAGYQQTLPPERGQAHYSEPILLS